MMVDLIEKRKDTLLNIKIRGEVIEQIEQFVYLGVYYYISYICIYVFFVDSLLYHILVIISNVSEVRPVLLGF